MNRLAFYPTMSTQWPSFPGEDYGCFDAEPPQRQKQSSLLDERDYTKFRVCDGYLVNGPIDVERPYRL